MGDDNGWVKLHRKLLENPIAKKPAYCHLWTHLLLRASHKETEFIWNNKRLTLQAGQLLTGRPHLSRETGIPGGTVEKILTYLESEHQIEQHKTNKFRIITVKNWVFYQSDEQKEQQRDSKRTTKEQQRDTYKNVKNVKNIKNVKKTSSLELQALRLTRLLIDLIVARKPDFKKPDVEKSAVDIDRMIRLDKRTPERIEAVIRWCQADRFWQANILSTQKLREKFDQLELKMDKGRHERRKDREFSRQHSEVGSVVAM